MLMKNLLRSSIFAGIAIGTAGFGFLAAGVQSDAYGQIYQEHSHSQGNTVAVLLAVTKRPHTMGPVERLREN